MDTLWIIAKYAVAIVMLPPGSLVLAGLIAAVLLDVDAAAKERENKK